MAALVKADDILRRDLDEIVENFGEGWQALDGARIFITGGTGFIGRWLLESLRHAKLRLGIKIAATILTRDYAKFVSKAHHLAEFDGFSFLSGNVIDFAADIGLSHIVHAATDASAQLNAENPRRCSTPLSRERGKVLELAAHNQGARVLNFSSGAVYGKQPPEIARVDENWLGAPDCQVAGQRLWRRQAGGGNALRHLRSSNLASMSSSARIFALLGPLLPLGPISPLEISFSTR